MQSLNNTKLKQHKNLNSTKSKQYKILNNLKSKQYKIETVQNVNNTKSNGVARHT